LPTYYSFLVKKAIGIKYVGLLRLCAVIW
jgi:hypothetical protein